MKTILFSLIALGLIGSFLAGSAFVPEWVRSPLAFVALISLMAIAFGIGYELGLRAPTDIESLWHQGLFSKWLGGHSRKDRDYLKK